MAVAGLIARLFAAFYLVAAGGGAAAWIAWRLVAQLPAVLRWSGMAVAGMFMATLAFHAMVPLYLFRLPVALAGATLVLAALWRDRVFMRAMLARERRVVRGFARSFRLSPRRGWLVAFAVCAAPVVLRPFALPPLSWDTLTYHAVKAAFWVQHGGPALVLDGPGTWDFNRNLFAGGEVFLGWAMLPMHGDLLVGPMQVLQWLGFGLGLVAVARELGGREPWGSAAAALVLTCATVRLEVGSGYVELALGVVTAASFAFTLRFLRRGDPGALVMACAAYGIACGIKLIALPVAAVGLVFLLLAVLIRWRRWRALALAAVVFVLAAAPWMIHNTVDTGRPLTPAPIQIAGLELGRATPSALVEMRRPDLKPYVYPAEEDALEHTFQGPQGEKESLGVQILIAMVVFVLAWPWLLWKRRAAAAFLLLAAAANIAVIFSPGMAVVRLYWPDGVSRFWIAALCAMVPASVAWAPRWPGLGRAYLYFLVGASFFLLLRLSVLGVSEYGFDALVWAAVSVGVVVLAASWLEGRSGRTWICALLALAVFVRFVGYREGNRYEAIQHEYLLHNIPHDPLFGAKLLEDGRPHRIAVTAGSNRNAANWLFYPYFGRRLQNEIVYVSPTKSGAIEHDTGLLAKLSDEATWTQRLAERGITDVVSLPPATTELGWMEKAPERFERLTGANGKWGVFRLKATPPKP